MKIIHVIFALNTGGAETMLVDVVNQQVQSEIVTLIIVNNNINKRLLGEIDHRVKVIFIGRKEQSSNPIPIIKLNLYLLMVNFDVIHCHQPALANVITFKGKIVLTVHGMHVKTNNLKYFKKIFAISNAVKSDIEQRSSVKAVLVYNGIQPFKIKQKDNYDFKIFRIVQVGRLDHENKGQHILLEALGILQKGNGNENISVDFIGEGQSIEYLQHLVAKYHLESKVNFLGLKERDYVYEHLKDYNLLVQPSLCEGFGLTIAEGMIAKIPVLVSDIDGPLEVVGNGKYGWTFESENALDCAKKIISLYKDYMNVNNFCKISEAYKHSLHLFNIQETSKNYILEYQYI